MTTADRKSPPHRIAELSTDLERLRGELTRRERDAESLQREKSRLQRKNSRLQRENDRLKQQIEDLKRQLDEARRAAFTHLRTGSPCRDRIGLLNVLLAEGINLGLRKMAEATTTHGFWELMRIARALAIIVEAQAALPMAGFWGTGRTASSDGQFFPAAGRGEALNLVNARYGAEPGVKAY